MVSIEKSIIELHKIFRFFNNELFNNSLEEPAILIQYQNNNQDSYGWITTNKIWFGNENKKYELNICAEYLNRGLYKVSATILHEMVHLHNIMNNIKDTSRGNTYHNKRFKEESEKIGLNIDYDKKIGWSITTLSKKLVMMIDKENFNKDVFTIAREKNLIGRKKKDSSSRKYVCNGCGIIVRATKDVNIKCVDCDTAMEKESK